MLNIPEAEEEEKSHGAVGLFQTGGDAESDSSESQTDSQKNDLFQPSYPQPSTWTGLVDLDKEGINSIVSNESSEISEEHVVIHLGQEEASPDGWAEEREESEREPEEATAPKIMSLLGLTEQETAENQGGSAKEEQETGEGAEEEVELSFTSDLSTASPTPEVHTSEGVLSSLVNTIMRPWRYWTGATEADVPSTPSSLTNEPTQEIQEPEPKSEEVKAGWSKGSVNAIAEPSHKTSTVVSLASTDNGLAEQERELVLKVQHAVTATQKDLGSPSKGQNNLFEDQTTSYGISSSIPCSLPLGIFLYLFVWKLSDCV